MKTRPFFRKIPGWAYIIVVGAVLYLSGWHTEVIGKVQSLILYTGLIKPDIASNEVIDENKQSLQQFVVSPKDELIFKSLSGQTYSLEDLRGKVVFLNIWATWCPPCIAEMPGIQQLYEKVNSEHIAFVMLSVDKDVGKVISFLDRKNYTFPIYTPVSSFPEILKSRVIPTTFVISPDGKIVFRKEGMANYNSVEFAEFLKDMVVVL